MLSFLAINKSCNKCILSNAFDKSISKVPAKCLHHKTSDGSVTIYSSSFNIMFRCDCDVSAIYGHTASNKSLFDAPGLHLDKNNL